MEPEQTNPIVEMTPKNQKLECSCFMQEDCELHDLNPQKRLDIMDRAIEKVQNIANGRDTTWFTSEQYMTYFSCVFFFSSIRYHGTYTGAVYQRFVEALQDNILEVILPSLEGKDNVQLLMKTMEMWAKYKILAHWLLRFFEPLGPFCSMTKGTDITDVPYYLFCDWVFDRMWNRLRGAVMRMIFQQRARRPVNLDMIKAGIDLFMEVDHKGKRFYYKNFEQVLLSHIDGRYNKLANKWLLSCSFHEYLKKALNCMYIEERRMGHYLPRNTMANVIEVTRYELMDKRIRTVVELLFRDGRHAF
ncbi:hypothetical protein Vadar_028193 [Vaccinium darrowii]|uniref:Uncharacterized protein n=1 Tax=Vaccinium darrowii TaxID=229202 RepID=A0ACB7Y3M4_9ERIC|nr:hypothetical protein Vadar_028193 [Vaccinium darrowii]